MSSELTYSAADLANKMLDVLIIGSGPAAVAVAEHLYDDAPNATIGILERGGILATTHINNVLSEAPGARVDSPINLRASFITDHEEFLWLGTFQRMGMMILALGGRGLVAGAQLRRFYGWDFGAWKNGIWPLLACELNRFYTQAEVRRHVRSGDCDGAAQNWARGALFGFAAAPPPWGVDSPTLRNFETGLGYDSSVSRLWRLILLDHHRAKESKEPRLFVALHALATRLQSLDGRVTSVHCYDARFPQEGQRQSAEICARMVILAASPIESARLMLNSRLGTPATGTHLAEHIYYRRSISVTPPEVGDTRRLAIRLVVPPQKEALPERSQIEVLGEEDRETPGNIRLRFTGEVAMDPRPENKVTVGEAADEFGVPRAHVSISLSPDDRLRQSVMQNTMGAVAESLGIDRDHFETHATNEIVEYQPGRSHHEAGTLRMGASNESDDLRVTDRNGRVVGVENLYVADASVFPSVGVSNPMLTVTALGYRLAEHLAARL